MIFFILLGIVSIHMTFTENYHRPLNGTITIETIARLKISPDIFRIACIIQDTGSTPKESLTNLSITIVEFKKILKDQFKDNVEIQTTMSQTSRSDQRLDFTSQQLMIIETKSFDIRNSLIETVIDYKKTQKIQYMEHDTSMDLKDDVQNQLIRKGTKQIMEQAQIFKEIMGINFINLSSVRSYQQQGDFQPRRFNQDVNLNQNFMKKGSMAMDAMPVANEVSSESAPIKTEYSLTMTADLMHQPTVEFTSIVNKVNNQKSSL